MSFLYNRCPKNVLEVANYLMEKYQNTDLSYVDFIRVPKETQEDEVQTSPDAEEEAV